MAALLSFRFSTIRPLRRTGLAVLVLLFTGLLSGPVLAQSSFTVTSTGDGADAALGDGNCETSDGECTLRAAIAEANQSPEEDVIEFGDLSQDGSAVISPGTPLPEVNESTVIDGTTEPSYTAEDGPVIVLDGGSVSDSGSDGLVFFGSEASGSQLRALAIVNFPEEGIQVQAGAEGVTIEGCYLGVEPDGTTAAGNAGSGIWIGSNNNMIGTAGEGNLISGNGNIGIEITGDGNEVRNNLVGVTADAAGTLSNGGGSHEEGGVIVRGGSGNDLVSNVIAGNDGQGIFVTGGSHNNSIRSNYIGTSQGLSDLGNTFNGIRIDSSPQSDDGENEVYDENIIAFNRNYGISVNGDYSDITNNYIGTNHNGDNLGNYIGGIRVAAQNVIVGHSQVGGEGQSGNVIGFNGFHGIRLLEGGGNHIRGNYIGTNASEENLGNTRAGIEVTARGDSASVNHKIGYGFDEAVPDDPSPANGEQGNIIAYNGTAGIFLEGDGAVLGNAIRGNSIHSNGGDNDTEIGIDLGDDGATDNDTGDGDEGANNLQNAPEIDSDGTDYDPNTDQVTVRYKVDSNPVNSAYGSGGLKVDFYVADSEAGGEGERYLYTDQYPETEATTYREITFEPPSTANISQSDQIVATATDADGNTSEFSLTPATKLPVELASFKGTRVGESEVELAWETTSETNNVGFEVQHRVRSSGQDGATEEENAWQKLGFVESKAEEGTTTEVNNYQYAAKELGLGTHEFRLLQVDLDGTTHAHEPVTVNLGMKEAGRLSPPAPNPVSGRSVVSFAVKEEVETTVTLYNVLGQEVATLFEGTPRAEEKQTLQLDATDLSSGMYFLRLKSGGQVKTQRVTVVR